MNGSSSDGGKSGDGYDKVVVTNDDLELPMSDNQSKMRNKQNIRLGLPQKQLDPSTEPKNELSVEKERLGRYIRMDYHYYYY